MTHRRTIALLIGLYLLVKIVTQVFGDPFGYRGDYYALYPGMIANEIIEYGARDPVYLNRGVPLYAAPIVAGYITVPFFLVLGKSLLTMRLVSLLISTTGFVLTLVFLGRYFRARVGVITALLWIFPPIFFFTYDTLAFEVHEVLVVINALLLLIFYRIIFDRRREWYLFALAGFIGGFGTYYLVNAAFIIPVLLVLLYAVDKRAVLSWNAVILVAAFVIGLIPWVVICQVEFAHRHGAPFHLALGHQIGENLRQLLVRFPRSFFFLERSLYTSEPSDKLDMSRLYPWLSPTLYRGYFSIFMVSFLAMLWRLRRQFARTASSLFSLRREILPDEGLRAIPLLVMPVFFPLLYSFTTGTGSSPIASRYLLPVHPFMFMIMALFLDRLWLARVGSRRLAPLAVAVVAYLTGVFVVSMAPAMDLRNASQLLTTRGYGYHLFYKLSQIKYEPENLDQFLATVKGRRALYKPEMYFGLGYFSTKKAVLSRSLLEEAYVPFYYMSLGRHTRGSKLPILGRPRNEVGDALYGKDSIFYYQGLGTVMDVGQALAASNRDYSEELQRGIHRAAGFRLALDGQWARHLGVSDEALRGEVYRGMGWYYGALLEIPEDSRYTSDLKLSVEWLETAYRTRHSAEWETVRGKARELRSRARQEFQRGVAEGRAAMSQLLAVCE